MKPELRPGDVHIVANLETKKAKCFLAGGDLRWTVEVHGEGIDGPGYNPDTWGGDTPPGLYEITAVEQIPARDPDAPAYGWYYLYLLEHEGQESKRGRAGIGWHGGGSGLPDPWAPFQGWQVTHGCLRSQNEDLKSVVVPTVQFTLKRGCRVWLSVVAP